MELLFATGTVETLIFLHIPKAAGSTLQKILDREYAGRPAFTIQGDSVRESIERFRKLPADARSRLTLLKGHMHFGLHTYLPQPSTYATLLRDPVERVISHYFYVLRQPEHYLHRTIVTGGMSLDACLEGKISPELTNGQTRLLAGMEDEHGDCTADALELAKRNLRGYFAVVGLQERFDESLLLLKKRFGWRTPYYTKKNVGNNGLRPGITAETVDRIRRHNALDMALYDFAKALFDQQIQRQGPSLAKELKRFRALNRSYGTFYSRALDAWLRIRKAATGCRLTSPALTRR